MEKLGDILKKTLEGIPKENTGTWSIGNIELPENDLAENPCPICHGAGFVHPLLDSGKTDYKRVVPCECTSERIKQESHDKLQKFSNLGSLTRLTFEKLLPDGRVINGLKIPGFKKAYEAAMEYAHNPEGWLILIGPNGCGKTHLASAIANYQLSITKSIFYIELANLLDHLRATYKLNSEIEYDELFEQLKNTPLLILDDVSISNRTLWAKEKIQQLMNHRYNERIPTVITSSHSVSELEKNLDCHFMDTEISHIYVIQNKSEMDIKRFGGIELELIKNMSFKNFNCNRLNLSVEQRQNLEQAHRIAYSFAQSPQGWLVLLGDNGCGKTHLAASIANHLHYSDKQVLFIVVPDFLDYLRSTFGPDSQISYDEIFEIVKKAPVLILDDFGEHSATHWTQEKLYQLINYRYNARLATVITTCFSLDEIESRISSRMVDPSLSLVFNILATDYRGDRKSIGKKTHTQYKKVDNTK